MAKEFNITTGEIIDVPDMPIADETTRYNTALNILRQERNSLLAQSDWTQLGDAALTDAKKTEWATYRQQLRDLPSSLTTNDDIDNLVWPTQPE